MSNKISLEKILNNYLNNPDSKKYKAAYLAHKNEFDEIMKKELVPELLISIFHPEKISKEKAMEILSDKKKLNRYIKSLQIEPVIDHRDELLQVAEEQFKKRNFGLSVALFASIIEHSVNKIISVRCSQKKLKDKTKKEILRNCDIQSKCTWLLELLDLPPFLTSYINIIKTTSDERNTYLHYKWNPITNFDEIPDLAKDNKENNEKRKKILSVLKYLKQYESRIEFKGNKSKLKDIFTIEPN